MKKMMLFIIPVFLLAGCFAGPAAPTMSDDDLATRVAAIVNSAITPTPEVPFLPTTTQPLPTLDLSTTQPVQSTPVIITSTPQATEVVATETEEPEITPTEEVEEPTIEPTPTLSDDDPRTLFGKPTSTDPLENRTKWGWPDTDDKYLSLSWKNGALFITGLTDVAGWRLPMTPELEDAYIEVKAKNGACTGKDNFGIIFRVPVYAEADRGYLFGVSCDGYYNLWKWDGKVAPDGKATYLAGWTKSDLINTGEDAVNRIGVLTRGDEISLYVNGELLKTVKDASYKSGYFGLFVDSNKTSKFTVQFTEMSYWEDVTE